MPKPELAGRWQEEPIVLILRDYRPVRLLRSGRLAIPMNACDRQEERAVLGCGHRMRQSSRDGKQLLRQEVISLPIHRKVNLPFQDMNGYRSVGTMLVHPTARL